jgi:hypothetical protein
MKKRWILLIVPLVCRKSAATAVSMVMCKWLFIALVLLVVI